MTAVIPNLTLDQFKQIAKNHREALIELDIEFSHQSSLNVTAIAFGYPNYNTAKALLEKTSMSQMSNFVRCQDEPNYVTSVGNMVVFRYTEKEMVRHYLTQGFSLEESNDLGNWHYNLYGGYSVEPTMDVDFGEDDSDDVEARKVQVLLYFFLWMFDGYKDMLSPDISNEWCNFTDTDGWKKKYGKDLLNSSDLMTEHIAAVLGVTYDEGVELVRKERARFNGTVV